MVLNCGVSPLPPETLGSAWRHFWSLQLRRCYRHLVGKARDAGKHPIRHGMAAAMKNSLAPNASSAKVQKPCTSIYQFYVVI